MAASTGKMYSLAEEEKLIQLVKGHSCIWDINNKMYHDRPRKQLIFQQIGQELAIVPVPCE